jgi:predicted alpha/beta-fold hydrolase
VLITPDDDDLVLDHLDGPPGTSGARFVLLHGLEGSSYSVYIQGLLAVIARAGFAATAINFRSCARDPRNISRMLPNRQRRLYHSGETTDFDFLVRTLRAREPDVAVIAVGASLGGNVLLKWLGENPGQRFVAAAATMSVPYDLGAGADFMENGAAGRFYVSRFLSTLRAKALLRHGLDRAAVMRARTFRQFDDAATAPVHGFTGADDYYARSSSIGFLDKITTPTLCISAADDPFLPRQVLDRVRRVASDCVEFRVTECGGHTGFIAGSLPWRCEYWAEELIVKWLLEK